MIAGRPQNVVPAPPRSGTLSYTVTSVSGSGAALVGGVMAQVSENPSVANAGIMIGMAGLVTAIGSVVIPLAKIFKDSSAIKQQNDELKADNEELIRKLDEANVEIKEARREVKEANAKVIEFIANNTARIIKHTDVNKENIAGLARQQEEIERRQTREIRKAAHSSDEIPTGEHGTIPGPQETRP